MHMKLIAYYLPLFAHVRNIPSEKREVASHYRRLPQAFAAGGQRETDESAIVWGACGVYVKGQSNQRQTLYTSPPGS